MRAAVYLAPGRIEVQEVEMPTVGSEDTLLRVTAVGICGSDLHVYRKGLFGARPGWIMGHEFSGEVVRVGDQVQGITTGERYTGFTIRTCGECRWCKAGQPRLCPDLFEHYTGYGSPGAMAEYVLIEHSQVGANLFRIPDTLDNQQAAMAEPLGTALYALRRVKPQDGDTVVVIGAGMIGNLIVQALKATTNTRVIVTEVSPDRAQQALLVGADEVIDALRPDVLEAVRAATGSSRYMFGDSGNADIVIDAAAGPQTFAQALEFVRTKGTVGLVGAAESASAADVSLIVYKDIKIVGIIGSMIPSGLDLLATGKIDTDPLISDRFPLAEAAAAFDRAVAPSSLKVMMFP
jgi:threonine dehydrogenase-like Zn-dependent dehydrogenase